ncbi:alkaline phosphatase D family protein [Horticoccus sp. 23ND18S-11]|uniref:alkaline phosphatase D family protein n=1 Tax=Horticoccus sp. 23ND18S-11 TaxID=3391832 RepID=UPI0039C8FB6C
MPNEPRLNRRAFLHRSAALAATSLLASRLSPLLHAGEPGTAYRSAWDRSPDRIWLGPELWANPMQDWQLAGGRVECVNPAPDRNVHLLTRQLAHRAGTLELNVHIGRVGGGPLAGSGSAGFRIGILGTLKDYPELHDYRNNLWPAPGAGFDAGFTAGGVLFLQRLGAPNGVKLDLARESVDLRLTVGPQGGGYTATLTALDPANARTLAQVKLDGINGDALVGNVALVNNFSAPGDGALNAKGKAKAKAKTAGAGPGPGLGQFWFSDWSVGGTKLTGRDDQTFGPILWSQYTLTGGVLKLSAQMPPLGNGDSDTVRLQVKTGATWKTLGEEKIHPEARTAAFRVAAWDDTKDADYRLAYTLKARDGSGVEHYWTGTVRRDPVDRETLTVGDVSCNIHTIFPNVPYVRSMAQLNPDFLAFVGDQFYESCGGYGVQRAPLDKAMLDYLRKWYFHGWTWRDLTRDRPSISLPDDHDVYQGNLWGESGEGQVTTQEAGGYNMPAAWVNVVHRTQTAHHPAPYDPAPAKRGTLNYYGPLTYGRISFAILADRQFKPGPEGKVPPTGDRGDHVKDPNFDPKTADLPGLELLGSTQEKFLREWVLDWKGADMKAVISQTIFAAMATTHGGSQEVLVADYDANGWPQAGRIRALREIRKAFAVHIAGDQHLPAVIQYGLDTHRDGPIAFAGPAVNVGYPRWWEPTKTGRNKSTGNAKLTGDFIDHFGNPMTVLAVKNGPYEPPRPALESVNAKTSGLGLVRFNKAKRTITLECWPYSADVTKPGTQMETWPVTVTQLDNYARKPAAHLVELQISGVKNPVVQVFEEKTGELVYALRLNGQTFRPHVFATGKYTVKVLEPESSRSATVAGLEASAGNQDKLNVTI